MYSTPVATAVAALVPLSEAERLALLREAPLTSLAAAFAHVPDPRRRAGQRYSLPFLLICLVAALLCNCNSTQAVEEWCRAHPALLRRYVGPGRFLTPSGSLYRRLLPRLSVEHLEWALAGWLRATRPVDDREPIARGGKTIRGAGIAPQAAPHLLTLYTHQTQEVLLQVRVDDKTNEIPLAQALLPAFCTPGRVVTADALHTQTAFVATVRAHGGHVVLTVKGNQPTLFADIATLFADPLTITQTAQTTDRHRGRREQRQLRLSTELASFLHTHSPWRDIGQVGELTRTVTTVTTATRTTREVVYLLTTLSPCQACPRCLLRLVRHHWHIENGLHSVRDGTFGEDRSRLRTGQAPQILAACRNLALTLLRRTGVRAIATARRVLAYQPEQALALLFPTPPAT